MHFRIGRAEIRIVEAQSTEGSSLNGGETYYIFNKEHGVGVRIDENADRAALVGRRQTKDDTKGYQWRLEQHRVDRPEYTIYNEDLKWFAVRGHANSSSVHTGNNHQWWIITPSRRKKGCYLISHLEGGYWGLDEGSDGTTLKLRDSTGDDANLWEVVPARAIAPKIPSVSSPWAPNRPASRTESQPNVPTAGTRVATPDEAPKRSTSYSGRLDPGQENTTDHIQGFGNPNGPEEHDFIREEIRKSHRFESFAGTRENNAVKWHIDGHDYFWAMSEILDSAQECIFILDWWLSPELYLRRPPADNYEWRLDRLLQRKAQQGVMVYVIVYKEVTQAGMSSKHTKDALSALHPNIKCLRYPNHIGAGLTMQFWSHHEKVVVVDNTRACIGGLDACFGRWDTHNHPLADCHPTDFSRTLFPGQDYNNARVLDFQKVDNYVSNQVSLRDTARMPWHDVHMTLIGPVVLDIVQHFVERWNEIKMRKYVDAPVDWLALPHDVSAAPEEPVRCHPHREKWDHVGRRFKQRWHGEDAPPDDEEGHSPYGTCRVQVVRSVSNWSHGVLTENSIQMAYRQLIMEANHFIYIESQFFISNTGDYGPVKNLVAKALVDRIISAAKSGQKFKVIVVIPEVPGFAGNINNEGGIKTIMAAQYRTINRGGHSIYEEIRNAGFEPTDYIRFYHLRTYDRINAPSTLIEQMEQYSGVTFHQAQVAQARRWIGDDGFWHQEKVSIKAPVSDAGAWMGVVGRARGAHGAAEEVDMPETTQQAGEIVNQFENGAMRRDEGGSDTVGQHALMDRTALMDETWEGTEEEERDCYVSEMLYVHSKVMIVDDRRVIMGSADINDRSQRGDRDSEIALVVEDTDQIESMMDGYPYMASRFAATLRRKLFREHLGLIEPQICANGDEPVTWFMRPAPIPNDDEIGLREDRAVTDPLSDHFQNLWIGTAQKNRAIFSELFKTVPANIIQNWEDYKNYVPRVKTGHLATELDLATVKEKLSQIHGHLVEAPLEFVIEEKNLVQNTDWAGLNPRLSIYI